MKLYKATIEIVPNNCYLETVLIVAESKEDAHRLLAKKNGQWGVTYTEELEEIVIDLAQKIVLCVGRGCNASDSRGIDF